MDNLSLDTIPAWITGLVMLYTGLMWLLTRKLEIRLGSRAVAFTLIMWGTLYTLSAFSPTNGQHIEILIRVLISRVVIIMICVSQSLPLTIAYYRNKRRNDGLG